MVLTTTLGFSFDMTTIPFFLAENGLYGYLKLSIFLMLWADITKIFLLLLDFVF